MTASGQPINSPASSRSRRAVRRCSSASCSFRQSSSAAAMPTARATGSVPGTQAVLLMAAEKDRLHCRAVTKQEGGNAHGPLKLVGGDAHGGDAQAAEVDRQLAGHGDRVGVQGHAPAIANRRDFGDRFEHARLVVAQSRADQPGLVAQQRGEAIRADQPGGVDAQGVEPPALFQEPLGRLDHAGVFDRGDDDVCGRSFLGLGDPQDGEVVGLGAAAGEDEPVRLEVAEVGAENFGDLFAGVFKAAAGVLARLVLTGRVGVALGEAAGNGVSDLRAGRRGGAVVEVDRFHFQIIDASCCLSKVCVATILLLPRTCPAQYHAWRSPRTRKFHGKWEASVAEQSSVVVVFRALVMTACLIAIPLAALFGASLPDA